ncbi:MAG: hypothetical protein AAFX92_02210 [Pseudomonadota bacterium]
MGAGRGLIAGLALALVGAGISSTVSAEVSGHGHSDEPSIAGIIPAQADSKDPVGTSDDAVTLEAAIGGASGIGEHARLEFLGPQEALLSRDTDGFVLVPFLNDMLATPGERVVELTIEVVEDGGGWPELLVAAGLIHGFQGTDQPYTAFVLSPEDGGLAMVAENVVDGGFAVGQAIGGSGTANGTPVTLTLTENADGSVTFEAGSSRTTVQNDVTVSGTEGVGDMGVIIVGAGLYRLTDIDFRSR